MAPNNSYGTISDLRADGAWLRNLVDSLCTLEPVELRSAWWSAIAHVWPMSSGF